MSRTVTLDPTTISILQADHMTAHMDTESGSRYTLVARPKVGVVLIHDDRGWAKQGQSFKIVDGSLHMYDRQGSVVFRTSRVMHAFIMSN